MNKKAYSVTEVTTYINNLLIKDINLSAIFVQGEISNLKMHSSKHIYFTLKDETASIKCVMFANYSTSLDFVMKNGMNVIVFGKISIFKKAGIYQLYASKITPAGVGELYLKFEQLKKDLSKEGLFKEEIKKSIKAYPSRVSVITSITSAALRDFLNVAKRRSKNVEIFLYNVLVQGESSSNQIAQAIEYINKNIKCDTIVITRGGGSIEDLWPFNEEITARAIYNSIIPVVSAIGHETDYTISDMVADLRAPTPSAAAELVIPDSQKVSIEISEIKNRIESLMYKKIQKNNNDLKLIEDKNVLNQFSEFISLKYEKLDYFKEVIEKTMKQTLTINQDNIKNLERIIESVSPNNVLERGYSYILDDNGKLIRTIKDINKNDFVSIYLKDGKIKTKVKEVIKDE